MEPVRFDERLSRLEALAAELERGDLSLEAAMERYQHGIELLRLCQQELAGFQGRVEELSKAAADALADLGPGSTGDAGRAADTADTDREP